MLLLDVAEQYIQLNIYNAETARAIRTACRLFDVRSGITDCRAITPTHLGHFRDNTLSRARPTSFNTYLRHIKLVAKWGQDEDLVDADYLLKWRQAPVPKAAPNVVHHSDLKGVIMALQKHPGMVPASWFWIIAIRTFYSVGLRRRQLVELKYKDIDWQRKILRLASRGSKTYRAWEVPLTDSVLTDLRVMTPAIEKALGRAIAGDDRLFNICYFNKRCTADPQDPTRMRSDYITKILWKISERSGHKIGAHRLRHTTATKLCNPDDPVKNPPDIFFAQHVLGHTRLSTTQLYVQINVENRRGYMNKHLNL